MPVHVRVTALLTTLAIAYLALGVYIAVRHGDEADAITEVRT